MADSKAICGSQDAQIVNVNVTALNSIILFDFQAKLVQDKIQSTLRAKLAQNKTWSTLLAKLAENKT